MRFFFFSICICVVKSTVFEVQTSFSPNLSPNVTFTAQESAIISEAKVTTPLFPLLEQIFSPPATLSHLKFPLDQTNVCQARFLFSFSSFLYLFL